jgi:maltose alpha-D-glucosyltransferase/alpha-amylase
MITIGVDQRRPRQEYRCGMTEAPHHQRPDAALGLDGVPHTGESITVDGHLVEPQAGDFRHARSAPPEAQWYKSAVFYEVLVRAFNDSGNDGTGDLRGLADKLDYLEWLGIDCLWLPPFYASPLRDGGYDISDFRAVLPEFGDVVDFVYLLDQAHRRGIRVITDLVLNHTSDAHPWFQESRQHPDGPYGDFYVWSDTDTSYADARVIFVDTETSNWTFDPVRGQFYWHRFFSHQPDLNYANPDVAEAMLDVLRFWLDLGIDGFRLDAVPYLFEEEGTNCENLTNTHEFLRRCRKVVDVEYPGSVLLAEANQWPADVVEYFGDPSSGGDECHMAFHFPLMPRIFMAVRRESRFPISEILAQTPAIPSGCQWGIFLRNHDELTLEMVTDEERDYMYAEYAKDPRMKANIGIRRRLAPLLDNDRNQQELFTALLLSLPGSPVLYYGDEIGMGDNIWLGDRDGVRTPMQWTPDRNAGFSRCDPGRLYLPVIMDPVYGYQAVNVEAQSNSTSSLLHWTRRMLQVRREHPAFGLGDFTELGSSNPSVLAYLRRWVGAGGEVDVVFCVNNLSRFPQPVELDLSDHAERIPVELTGGVPFPPIGELPYLLTVPGHGFYWFKLADQADDGEGP